MPTSSSYYQPKSVTIHLRRLGTRNWGWYVADYFFEEIAHGSGCKTKRIAMEIARVRKVKYLESVEIVKLNLKVKKCP
jgi:hypothetical protein